MTFAEKLKAIRKQAGISQEELADKIGVSRQAITKWETGMGIPDIENIIAVSAFFNISIDELLSGEISIKQHCRFLYESVTEYDIEQAKRYDIKLGGAKALFLSGYDGEKIQVCLASDTVTTLQSDFKVKIDDIKRRIDVDVSRRNGMTEATAKNDVTIFVKLPNQYMGSIELAVNADTIEVKSLECDSIELDVKTRNIVLTDVTGTVEINCNLDMNICCNSLNGAVEINQISATSRICIPEGIDFAASVRGVKTGISYERDGISAEDFSNPDADNLIEINGLKSELVIDSIKREA